MNIKDTILESYRNEKNKYRNVEKIVTDILNEKLCEKNIKIQMIASRIKEENSLRGKINLKDGKYLSIKEITDILGVRVVCFFADGVDEVVKIVEDAFDVDRKNTIDKRSLLEDNAFGYMSVHYICYLKKENGYSADLCDVPFEIQIRSTLQNAWAEIEHDLGYKSEYGVPKEIRRDFSKVASILEIADEHFMRIRDGINNYGDKIREKIANDTADNINIDSISLMEYMKSSPKMKKFINTVSELCDAEIQNVSPEAYPKQLSYLGVKTLADINKMIDECGETALKLAKTAFSLFDIDIISTNAALRLLCRAYIIDKDCKKEYIEGFMKISNANPKRVLIEVERLLKIKDEINKADNK